MLTFVRRTTQSGARAHRAQFLCHCGQRVEALLQYVNSGRKTSCGCDAKPPKTHALFFDFDGERLTIREIIARTGSALAPGTVIARLRGGHPMRIALTMPKHEMLKGTRAKGPNRQSARLNYRALVMGREPWARIETFFDEGQFRSWRVLSKASGIIGRGRTQRYAWQAAWLAISKEKRAA